MRYVIKQKVFTLTDDFVIHDMDGNPRYHVKGKLLSLGDRLSFRTLSGEEVVTIRQKLLSFSPRYRIYRRGVLQAEVKKRKFTLLRDKFKVNMKDGTPDLEITGNLLDHNYRIERQGREVARVSKTWITVRDSYGADVAPGEDDVFILACVVVVDMISHGSSS
ncbi:MAG: LURP-one-related/scramblase family protein [Anaerolineae bacterium]